ncbi:MAG: transketolase family protein, partial [Clostridiales bacterium]|nr:transketolase family protein [Clostridiales bacterium]NLM05131.1 transketolase family protein [Clostridiales bacterium]
PVPVKRIGTKDTFGESGKPDELLKKYGLTAEDIANAVLELVDKK